MADNENIDLTAYGADYYLKDDCLYRIRPVVSYMLEAFGGGEWHQVFGAFLEKDRAVGQLRKMYVFDRIEDRSISEREGLEYELAVLQERCMKMTEPLNVRIEELKRLIADKTAEEGGERDGDKDEEGEPEE